MPGRLPIPVGDLFGSADEKRQLKAEDRSLYIVPRLSLDTHEVSIT